MNASRSGSRFSTDKVPAQVTRVSCGHMRNPSPEIKPDHHDMASVYSDAGDTFASRPSSATTCEGIHHLDQDPVRGNYSDSRDFILKRFLPAAQAMAETGAKSSTSTSSQHGLQKHSSARFPSSKRRSEDELQLAGDEENIKACGFPLHLGRLALQHLRYSFFGTTSRSTNSKPPLPLTTSKASQKVVSTQEEASDDSDDLFWSDEEGPEDRNIGAEATTSASEMRKRLATELLLRPTRLHSMETVHTPDHRGFLGLPKTTKAGTTTSATTGQVDRLGARLSRMITKTNYMDPPRVDDAASSSQSTATSSSTSMEAAAAPVRPSASKSSKWVDAVASLVPPPSPKMPSESWLSSTLPPEKLMEVKRMSRKSLGSFIPIKSNREDTPVRLRQSCSLKEHLQGRYNDA